MKKLLSHATITALAALALMSCAQHQEDAEKDVSLKVTYSIDCSRDLMDLCDLVVTYKGDAGVDVVDTISADPADTTYVTLWSQSVKTDTVPVKIGFDYTFVPKTDTLMTGRPNARLSAKCNIIAEKIGVRKGVGHLSENTINSETSFFVEHYMMNEDVVNTRKNLANIIDIYNDRQAYKRETSNNHTCYLVTSGSRGDKLKVRPACWTDK